MTTNYIYHLTMPTWIRNKTDRLGFILYARPPAHQPYRDHAPHEAMRLANPGSEVYAAFFFSDEKTAVDLAFKQLNIGQIVLRVSASDPALSNFSHAADDLDRTAGAHMRYRPDNCVPWSVPGGNRKVHPSWGIPFSRIEVKVSDGSNWVSMEKYVETLPQPSIPNYAQEVRESWENYRKAAVLTRYQNWWHRTLLWFKVQRARDNESLLQATRARAASVCKRSAQHRNYATLLAEQLPGCSADKKILLDLIKSI